MANEELELVALDPRCPEVAGLIAALSRELAQRYDFADDGSGHFQPEDVLVPGSGFLVGRVGGECVACGAFRPLDGKVCEIKRMFVMATCRCRGYAGAVLAELERLAVAAGYTAARLETGTRQPEAIRLYERAGYQRIPNFGVYVGSERSVCFEKRLTDGGTRVRARAPGS